jgi:preprotein translocase subunit SecF
MMLNIVGKRALFFVISAVFILIGVISLFTFGLRPGIEFSSGSIITLGFEQEVNEADLSQELASLGYGNAVIQTTGGGDFLIRLTELTDAEKTQLEEGLSAKFGAINETSFETIDPVIARQTAQTAGIAVAIAAAGILLYITWAFRRMPSPFRYGTCAVIALIHDVVIVLGIFSILGGVMDWEINIMFITGILAVIGYSVNNTVVVFDRVRENLIRRVSPHFEVVVNSSLTETLSRSLNTSLTTIFVVLALLLFVGAAIQNFAVVLLIGIIAGTFSSIGIAPMLLVVWDRWQQIRGQARA